MIEKKRVLYLATITCPFCSAKSEEEMSDNACQFFWECPACKRLVKPKKGDCCVFCSYSETPCPPIQKKESCC